MVRDGPFRCVLCVLAIQGIIFSSLCGGGLNRENKANTHKTIKSKDLVSVINIITLLRCEPPSPFPNPVSETAEIQRDEEKELSDMEDEKVVDVWCEAGWWSSGLLSNF
jgi:hypothetical protein